MLIRQCLKEREVTLSCELFPPKEGRLLSEYKEIARKVAALRPTFISVTYGAGGGTSAFTAEVASEVERCGVPALAHLTCVSSTKEGVRQVLTQLRERGIENVLALRGDIPKDAAFPLPDQYRHADELIADIRAFGGFCIGAACYPEGHPESANRRQDMDNLRRKVDSGVDFLTTQMFFDNNILYNFLYRAQAAGIRVPVIAGVMPVTNGKQIRRICRLSGTALPPRFAAIVDRFGEDPRAMRQAGIAYCTEQIIDLIANGVSHVHIYTMNQPEIAAKILDNLSEIFEPRA